MKRRSALKSPIVLLVEDEPLVRELDIDVLQESGFRVLEARTADEAFDILRRASQRMNIKLRELAERVASRTLPEEEGA